MLDVKVKHRPIYTYIMVLCCKPVCTCMLKYAYRYRMKLKFNTTTIRIYFVIRVLEVIKLHIYA